MRRGFTLVELLVVISIIGLLMAIMLPLLSQVREQAKVVVVNAELKQIGLCLDMYMDDNRGKSPPTRKNCSMGWEDYQLPPELVDSGYLPAPKSNTGMSVGVEDRFNRRNTYRYHGVGELFQNGRFMGDNMRALLYIPKNFPNDDGNPANDIKYDDPAKSPVTWAIFSQGPNLNSEREKWEIFKLLHCPVPKRTWYNSKERKGVIVRMRLKNGRHIGSFEGD